MTGSVPHTILLAQATTGAAPAAAQAAATGGSAAGATATQTSVPEPTTVFPPFDASTFGSQILWLVICFGALYIITARAVQPRLAGIVKARRDKIEGDLAEAERLRLATDKAVADYEAALAAARGKAHGIAEATRAASKAELDAKRAAVEADLAARMSAAESSIQTAKTTALTNVNDIAADTAAELLSKLTGAVTLDEVRDAVAQVVKG